MKRTTGIAVAICLGLITNCGIQEQTSKKTDAEVAYYQDGADWGNRLEDNDLEALKAIGVAALVATTAIIVGPKVTKIDEDGLKFWKGIDYKKAVEEAEAWKKVNILNDSQVQKIKKRAVISAPAKISKEPFYTPKLFKQSIKKFRNSDDTVNFQAFVETHPDVADFIVNQAASLSYLARNADQDVFERAYQATKLEMGDTKDAYNFFQHSQYDLKWVDVLAPEKTMETFRIQLPRMISNDTKYVEALHDLFKGSTDNTGNILDRIKNRFSSVSAADIANTRVKLDHQMADHLKKQLGVIHNNKQLKKAIDKIGMNHWVNNYWSRLQKELKSKKPNHSKINKIKKEMKKEFESDRVLKIAGKSEKHLEAYDLVKNFFNF